MDCGLSSGQVPNMSEINFEYADCDKHSVEMAELYTYSEMEDFALNFDAFTRYMEDKKIPCTWIRLSSKEQSKLLQDLAQRLDSADSTVRLTAARILLYILQGAYGDFAEEWEDEDPAIEEADDNLTTADKRKSRLSSGCDNKSLSERELSIGGSISPMDLKGIGQDRGTGGYEEPCLVAGAWNAYILYEAGFFQPLCCAERSHSRQSSVSNSRSASNVDLAQAESFERRNRKSATLADNESLRVVINCLYHMLESIRREDLQMKILLAIFAHEQKLQRRQKADFKSYTLERLTELRENFAAELDEPLESAKTPLIILLMDMMPAFVRGNSPHYPIKKVLLLAWKVLLATLGDLKFLSKEKARKRAEAGLKPIEDTLTVASKLKSTACERQQLDTDGVLSHLSRMGRKVRSLHPARPFNRQIALGSNFSQGDSVNKQHGSEEEDVPASTSSSNEEDGDDEVMIGPQTQPGGMIAVSIGEQHKTPEAPPTPKAETENYPNFPFKPADDKGDHEVQCPDTPVPTPDTRKISSVQQLLNTNGGDQTPKAESPLPVRQGLPWKPKVREKDLEQFLQNERQKYFGYKLPNDSETLFGLPTPVYGNLQIKADENFNKFPFSQIEYIEETSTEKLYRRMLPNMTEIIIALLKVILASLPSSKAKSDAVTILADVLTPETDTNEMLSNSINLDISSHNILEETVRVAIDINRHKELIIKASPQSLSHCSNSSGSTTFTSLRTFPNTWNGNEYPVLTADNVDEADTESPSYYLWRNVFSSINLLRVLNKLTKWKHARTMMLVVFKSAPVLKRCMRAKWLGIFQLYVLKLLKMQARYLGRQWRKSNMDIISSIYLKVRHRLNDDWAYANETRSKSWDFQVEEGELGLAVKKFNSRRYHHLLEPTMDSGGSSAGIATGGLFTGKSYIDDMDMKDFEPVDNSLQSVLSWQPKFSERFKRNYAKWVEEEVIQQKLDWDLLLLNTKGIAENCC
uniref:Striatin-interacting protein 1 n=1 Tax=Ditylenchus dipsaci TaxID=166011 RepID=A0A915CZG2_9BILA